MPIGRVQASRRLRIYRNAIRSQIFYGPVCATPVYGVDFLKGDGWDLGNIELAAFKFIPNKQAERNPHMGVKNVPLVASIQRPQ